MNVVGWSDSRGGSVYNHQTVEIGTDARAKPDCLSSDGHALRPQNPRDPVDGGRHTAHARVHMNYTCTRIMRVRKRSGKRRTPVGGEGFRERRRVTKEKKKIYAKTENIKKTHRSLRAQSTRTT